LNYKHTIAFIVGSFPEASETFIIDQAADLIDKGFNVKIFPFQNGSKENISPRYFEYDLASRTYSLEMPKNKFIRIIKAIPLFFKLLFQPKILIQVLNINKYGSDAKSLKLIFWTYPFINKSFNLYHCHFGPSGNRFLIIKDILKIKQKFITTFYGYDASLIFKKNPKAYERLKKEGDLFFAMSKNMKERLMSQGFDGNKVIVQPIGLNLEDYPFKERNFNSRPFQISSIGRFVEKKGFDDLLKALAIVKESSSLSFNCTIVGDGILKNQLQDLTRSLGLEKEIIYKGVQPINKIIKILEEMDLFIQPSKTALDGDME
jgi:colanic acid/amylovoran biosynthesis glycosyltransferase